MYSNILEFQMIKLSLCLYVRQPDRLLKILRVRQSDSFAKISHATQNI